MDPCCSSSYTILSLASQQRSSSSSLMKSKTTRSQKPRSETNPPLKTLYSSEFQMEVPRSEPPSPCSSSSCSSSFSSPFSSCLSSSSSAHSLASSSNTNPLSFSNSSTRCEGLDMLVKAVFCVVAGSVVGVPYIQKRVIRRRKRPIAFGNLIIREFVKNSEEDGEIEENLEGTRRTKRRRAAKSAFPSKYQDSVLHEWKPPTKRRRGSGKVTARSGL